MSGFEWFLVIVVVILVPLAIAVVVTLWTLEQARKRNPRNRPGGKASGTKRRAVRDLSNAGEASRVARDEESSSHAGTGPHEVPDDGPRERIERSG